MRTPNIFTNIEEKGFLIFSIEKEKIHNYYPTILKTYPGISLEELWVCHSKTCCHGFYFNTSLIRVIVLGADPSKWLLTYTDESTFRDLRSVIMLASE